MNNNQPDLTLTLTFMNRLLKSDPSINRSWRIIEVRYKHRCGSYKWKKTIGIVSDGSMCKDSKCIRILIGKRKDYCSRLCTGRNTSRKKMTPLAKKRFKKSTKLRENIRLISTKEKIPVI